MTGTEKNQKEAEKQKELKDMVAFQTIDGF